MGLFSFVTGLIGAGKQKKATRKAEAAMLEELQKGIAQQQQNFDLISGDYAPARAVLAPSVGAMGDLVGINGEATQQSAMDRLKASPLYKSLFSSGEEAVLQNAAATGGVRGGNTQRSLADFGADTFAQLIQRQLGNLGGLADIGLGGVGATANASTHNADALTALFGNRGDVRAGGALTRGGINAGMWNSAGKFLDDTVSSIFGGQALGAGANLSAMSSINSMLGNSSAMRDVNSIMRNSRFTIPAADF